MGDEALQEAIQRAKQLAAKMAQSAPIKRPPPDHSGPVKVTLAYEKPANSDQGNKQAYERRSAENRSAENRSAENRSPENHNTTSLLVEDDDRIEMIIPHAVIGLVIGKGGENIKRIQNESGATVRVDPNVVDEQGNKSCIITGSKQAVEDAKLAVENVIESAGTKRPRMATEGSNSFRMKIPASRTGAIIGKGGETIKSIKQQSGCDIELDKGAKECGPDESVFVLRGTQDKITRARSLIEARLASRGRDGPGRSAPKDVATGANAAPVASYTDLPAASYTDLPAAYPAAGQQNSADMSSAWAAYFAQFNLLNQGSQPDYADQWIAYYRAHGYEEYAQRVIELKKQQEAQKQQQ